MTSKCLFLVMACLVFQTNAAVLPKRYISPQLPLSNLPLANLPLLPNCGCNFPLIPEIITPIIEVPICSNVPTCNCPKPVIEIPTYFSSAVEVPSCGCANGFSTAVELALTGSGIPSCSCSNPVCGCSGSVCGCSGSVCGCSGSVCGCSGSVCGCSAPVCGCSKPVCGCSGPLCSCSGVDIPAYYYSPSVDVCGGCSDPLCSCGAYVSPVVTCGPTLPPFAPVLGCTKYLRQVVIQPPFL